MGYAFEIVGSAVADGGFSMNSSQMSMMCEFMREVGAVSDPGTQRALRDGPSVESGAASIRKFQSNSGQIVTADECFVIASRLRKHMDIVEDVASFFDDAPDPDELKRWLDEWIEFNTRAAEADGYRVS